MSKASSIKLKAERARRASLGLCIHCAKPSLPDRNGKRWRGCADCRRSHALEARALKDILYPPIPPKVFTASEWKCPREVDAMLRVKDISDRLKRRGLEVER